MYQLLSGKVWDSKWSAVGKKSIIFSSKEKKADVPSRIPEFIV